jgi:DNA-binding MarR family transcriptional regulator
MKTKTSITTNPCNLASRMSRSEPFAPVREWWEEFEKLEWFLGRLGPDDICCGGLTPRQCTILRILTSGKGERLSDLARVTGITPSAMTRVLERLEKQGLLHRVHGGMEDGRASTIAITPHGRETRALLDKFMMQRTEAILAAIPLGSRSEILTAVRKLNSAFANSGCCGLDPVTTLRKHRRHAARLSKQP